MEAIHDILRSISASHKQVLATIIHVEGSAYRKEGTSMLFDSDGTKVGVLSAGCLEVDLSHRVKNLFGSSRSETLVYHMQSEDDSSWGQGAGCNGVISVLLEPIYSLLSEHLILLKKYLKLGQKVTVLKKLDLNLAVSSYLFITEDQTIFGSWNREDASLEPTELLKYHSQKSGIVYSPDLASKIYIHTFEPKPRLFIFGANDDVIPLVDLAANTGYAVHLSDWRPALCTREVFPKADQFIIGFPHESLQRLTFRSSDSVVIASHNFQKDQQYVNTLLNKNISYLGILGSTDRTQRLLGGKEISTHIKSPVGLSIGAEGPEEIAVSIVAELIQQRKIRKEMIFDDKQRNHRHIPCSG